MNILRKETQIFIFITIILFISIYQLDKGKKIFALFQNKSWLFNFIIIILFSVYIIDIQKENDTTSHKLKDAVRKGLLALIIAILAHLELTIAPFWIVFLLAYYSQGYV
jgi:hypothetical protein